VRKNKPDYDTGWAQLLENIPAPHHAIIAERIAIYRNSDILRDIGGTTPLKQLVIELENFAGSELDAEYP
jgi:hypothetical protein